MRLKNKETRGVAVLEVSGKLIGGSGSADRFRDYFKKLIADGKKKAVVNLSDTTWATSQGIGMLIGAYTNMKNAGGTLVFSNASARIKDILRVTRLITIFELFDEEADAVDHLADRSGNGRAATTVQRLDTVPQLRPLRFVS